jgi:phosphoribosylformimino-5-aminoimidazole carboxamide ribotide isomerase
MILYPALDLRAGCVMRLKQGRASEQTVYSTDPASVAARWEGEGAAWLHVVDLDGAFGDPSQPNALALKQIRAAVKIPIQFGGGLRDLDRIERAFELGVNRVVLGTLAIEQPEQVEAVVQQFGAERIAAAMDLREGRVATRGWRGLSGVSALEFGRHLRAIGIERAVVTDIARDGMLSGIDADALARLARDTGLRVIASGGIATLNDLLALRQYEAIEGAIIGQALYAGAFSLGEALRVASPPTPLLFEETGEERGQTC